LIVDERVDTDGEDARASTARLIDARKANLREVTRQRRALFAQTRESLQGRVAASKLELEQLQYEQGTQRKRLEYAEISRQRYQQLAADGFVSPMAAQERAEAVVDQQGRLQALQRAQTALQRDLLALRAELRALPLREQTEVADLERSITQADQESVENKLRGEVVLTAPEAGRISGLVAQPGFAVGSDRPLLTLVPEHSDLEANLFAPSRDVGFVRLGQEVFVRYSAYPYQKFGHYRGVVTEVSHTPLSAGELDYALSPSAEVSTSLSNATLALASGPMFRIRVQLDRPTARAYGEEKPLQPGMQLEADILLDRRTLFEWILEPIYSLRGKYFR
jgi:membrane fusion protein